ncbi:hypothetical protein METHB2_50050 [Candidatus Methylobacter favarea]|uniref:VOC family protein n=1 Tax=Candidatus Methylobacter favarea TaxID=2707345 RepID=A0A8S0WR30_9GAMM|nr:hypothetical protein [Candidatus Methylobacter favarea]CAA9891779.1 hypothetical protein METHB2_50050 [Candidatus Methylobacter favarea]
MHNGGFVHEATSTVTTVCVDDLEKSVRFYEEGLELKTEGIIGKEFAHGTVAFFELQAGLKLAIWPRKSLAHDSGLPLGKPGATELPLGHNVSSKVEVDAVIVKPAQDTFWEATRVTFKTLTNTSGRSYGTHSGKSRSEA